MKNKNPNLILLSLLAIPCLIASLLVAGVSVLAEEESKPVIITIDTDRIAEKPLNYVHSQPEVKANLDVQKELTSELDADSRSNARFYSHVPVVATTLTNSEIDELEESELVENIVEESIFKPTLASSGAVIDADDAYLLGYDGNGVAVAILDTGVDNDHSFLNVVSEACYSNAGGFGGGTTLCPGGVNSSTAADSADTDQCSAASGCDHGTHVAGIAAGDGDGAAYTGIAKSSDIIAIQVFTQFNSGCAPDPSPCLGAFSSDIIAGLNRVLALHNDVGFSTPIASANLSLGGSLYSNQSTCDSYNSATKTAIDNLRAVDIATVIASSNDYSSTSISSPGCISTAVAVGATTDADVVASFSNSNSMVDLLAPGVNINSSIIGDGNFGSKSGTSMATPHVAGAWAVIKEKAPNATVDEVLQALQETGVNVNDPRNGLDFDRIDLDDALQHANFNSVLVNTTDNLTSENGGTATVEFRLATMPSADVTIPLSVPDNTEGTLGVVTQIVIASADWDTPSANQVTITGVDDSDFDARISYTLVTGDPSSTDPSYDALIDTDVADPSLANVDDEYMAYRDFNGDNLTDVLRSEDSWDVVYGGTTDWVTINSLSWPIDKMKFGDFDGDGETDLFRTANNQWYVSYSGTSSWTKIADSSYGVKHLEIVDFNGDGLSDIFRTSNGRWYVVYGGTSTWQQINSSAYKLPSMKFGDFDGDGETDILRTSNKKWYVSYSGTSSWDNIANSSYKLPSLALVDFNGDGLTDIFRTSNKRWYVVYGGTSTWQQINTSSYKLSNIKFGDFNGDAETDILRSSIGVWYVSYSGSSSWTFFTNAGNGLGQIAL